MSHQGDQKFWDWALELQNLNVQLLGTTSHMWEGAIHNLLEANRNLDLTESCHCKWVDDIQEFCGWMENIPCIDDKHCQEVNMQQLVEEMFRERAWKKNAGSGGNDCQQGGTPAQQQTMTNNQTIMARVPALTEHKRELLCRHNGCFKC